MANPRPFLTQMLLAHDQVALGDLVLSMDEPWNDFRQYPKALTERKDFIVSSQPLDRVFLDVSATDLESHADSFLKVALSSGHNSMESLQAQNAQCTRLSNSGDLFEEILDENEKEASEDVVSGSREVVPTRTSGSTSNNESPSIEAFQKKKENVKRWLEKCMVQRNSQAFMVVGLYTLTAAQVSRLNLVAQSGTFDARVGANFGATGRRQVLQGGAFVAPGTHIFAIEYRQVRLKRRLLRKRSLKDARLNAGRNVWKAFMGDTEQRVGAEKAEDQGEEDEEEEFYEASLVDELGEIGIEEVEE